MFFFLLLIFTIRQRIKEQQQQQRNNNNFQRYFSFSRREMYSLWNKMEKGLKKKKKKKSLSSLTPEYEDCRTRRFSRFQFDVAVASLRPVIAPLINYTNSARCTEIPYMSDRVQPVSINNRCRGARVSLIRHPLQTD